MRIVVRGTRDGRLTADIRRLGRQIDRDFAPGAVQVNVVFVNNRYIHALNRRFRKLDRPTDVLSFNLPPVPGPASAGPHVLGEVYVSRDQARLQAREYDVSLGSELRRLVLHGLLHVMGLGHRRMPPYHRRYLAAGRGRD
jgi:probable rRNA maturation factor